MGLKSTFCVFLVDKFTLQSPAKNGHIHEHKVAGKNIRMLHAFAFKSKCRDYLAIEINPSHPILQ